MKRPKFDLDYWAPLEPGEEERYAASSPLTPAAGGLPAVGEGRFAASVGANGGAPLAAPAVGGERYAAPVAGEGGVPLAAPAVGGERFAAPVAGEGGVPLAAPAVGEGRYAASHVGEAFDNEEECETDVAMVKMPTIVGQVKEKLPPFLQRIVEILPMSFKRIEAVDKGKALGFSAHTSDRYLKRLKLDGRLRKITKGCYCKVAK